MWQQAKNIYHWGVALLANIYYGFPSRTLTVVGITGTSGKTTTTHMVYHVLKEAGLHVSLLSTIEAVIGGKKYDTGFHVTTPDPHTLPKYLRQAVNNGDTHFVLEVSSHALDQHRAAFVHFNVGVLTTLAHEHLDYHKTFTNYAKAKFKLLHQADHVVIPHSGIPREVMAHVGYVALQGKIHTFGLEKGDETQKKWQLTLPMPGEFNLRNALAAATVGKLLHIPEATIKKALRTFTSIPGRFEEIPNNAGFRIVVDFAHKPDAIEGILQAARQKIGKKGRVIIMFGSASERDTLKRPIMGELSGRLADISVLTDEDPRYEDPMKILNEIAEGCVRAKAREFQISNFKFQIGEHVYCKIPNRKEAITFIITKLAKRGDIVLFCGKGHEKSMSYRGVEKPWDEHKVIKQALRFRSGQALKVKGQAKN